MHAVAICMHACMHVCTSHADPERMGISKQELMAMLEEVSRSREFACMHVCMHVCMHTARVHA